MSLNPNPTSPDTVKPPDTVPKDSQATRDSQTPSTGLTILTFNLFDQPLPSLTPSDSSAATPQNQGSTTAAPTFSVKLEAPASVVPGSLSHVATQAAPPTGSGTASLPDPGAISAPN